MNKKIFECGICFESLDPKQICNCTQLDCTHLFHDKCLFEWSKICQKKNNKPNCPLCRKEIPQDTLDLLDINKVHKKRNEIISNSINLFDYIIQNKLYHDKKNLLKIIQRYPEEINNILFMLKTIHLSN